jgi:cytochrome c-type biogenesis protein CcmH/NrfF
MSSVILWGVVGLLAVATVVLGLMVRRAKQRQAELRAMVERRLAAFG